MARFVLRPVEKESKVRKGKAKRKWETEMEKRRNTGNSTQIHTSNSLSRIGNLLDRIGQLRSMGQENRKENRKTGKRYGKRKKRKKTHENAPAIAFPELATY